jgi:hypothetical protein
MHALLVTEWLGWITQIQYLGVYPPQLVPHEYERSSSRYKATLQWAPKHKMAVFSRTAHMALIKLHSLMEIIKGKVNGKTIPVEAHKVVRHQGSHIFWTTGSQMALCTSRPLPPGWFLVLISVRGSVDSRAISAAGRIRSFEKSNDLIRNLTHDLLARSMVPQPNILPCATEITSPNKIVWTLYSGK